MKLDTRVHTVHSALAANNGSPLAVTSRAARCIAGAAGKTGIGGSDAHTRRGIGRTWTEVPGGTTREQLMPGLWAGDVRVGGGMGNVCTMASDVCRFTGNFLRDQAARPALVLEQVPHLAA